MSDLKPTNPKDRAATKRLDLSLFPDTGVIYGALGMVEGDAKYGGYNYRDGGVLASVYVAACRRHLAKWYNGEWADKKTNVPHLGSAIACLAILADAHECGVLKDDRPPAKANVSSLLDSCQEIVGHLHEIFQNGPPRHTELKNELARTRKSNHRTPGRKKGIRKTRRALYRKNSRQRKHRV